MTNAIRQAKKRNQSAVSRPRTKIALANKSQHKSDALKGGISNVSV
jgi:hypothetical protein